VVRQIETNAILTDRTSNATYGSIVAPIDGERIFKRRIHSSRLVSAGPAATTPRVSQNHRPVVAVY